MTRSVIIDRSKVEALMHNPEIHKIVPELSDRIKRAKSGTACCGKKTVNKIPAASIRSIKLALMGLPLDRKEKLKKLLKADSLVFNTVTNSGMTKSTL